MKSLHSILRLALGLVAISLYSPLVAQSEVEPNNSLIEATLIPLATNITGTINPAGDNDFYKFEITQPGVVSIRVFNVPANIDMDYQFFNENDISVATANYNDGENFVAEGLLCNPGTYKFRLGDNEGSPAQYTVRVDFDITDVYECNNSLPEASLISLGTIINASIQSANDNDYYKFCITEPGVINVTVSNVPSNIDMDFNIFDINQQQIFSANFGDGQSFSLPFLLCQAGCYYLRLADNEGNPAQYTLLVTQDITDQYECNQDLNNASPITCNTPVVGSINPANDVDCYEVTLTQPDIITAQVINVPANQNLTVTLHGPEPSTQELRRVNGNTGQSVTLVSPTTLQVGTYQVCITDNNTNAAQYQLSINCPSVVSTSEVPWANEVALYPNPTDGLLLLELPNTLAPHTVEYRIIDPLGRIWFTRQAQDQVEQVDASSLPAGYYFLQLNTADGRLTRTFLRL